jgi:hypothetical protein
MPVISGSITLKIDNVDDHYSMMHHFRNAVLESRWCDTDEFSQMLAEFLMDHPAEEYKFGASPLPDEGEESLGPS